MLSALLFGLFFIGVSQTTEDTTTAESQTNSEKTNSSNNPTTIEATTTSKGTTSTTEDPTTTTNKKIADQSTLHENATTVPSIITSKIMSTITSTKVSDLPTTSDVCSSVVSENEQDPKRKRRCTCNDFRDDIDCRYLDITSLPKLISFPKSSRDVSFAGNSIENIANNTFYNGREVVNLDLSHNRINFISIVAFRAFKNLKRLDLSHNKIWNVPPKSFDGLISLKYLNLGYNDIAVLTSDLFSAIPNLGELNLEANPLLELEPKLFEHLKYLEKLNLASTLLKVIPDHLLSFTHRLKILDLSNNQLSDVPSDALRYLHELHVLDLSGNPIKVIHEEAFLGMRIMVTLYLDRMPLLTKIDKYAFGDLQTLKELHCSYNFLLSEVDEKAFVRKTDNKKIDLDQLFLRQNLLIKLPKGLLNWNENMEMHLLDNPICCDCHTEWMIHLKLKNEFQKHVKCSCPSSFEGLSLDELKDKELACELAVTEIIMIVLASVVFLLILLLIIAFIVWRRNYTGYNRPYFRVSKKKHEDMDEGI